MKPSLQPTASWCFDSAARQRTSLKTRNFGDCFSPEFAKPWVTFPSANSFIGYRTSESKVGCRDPATSSFPDRLPSLLVGAREEPNEICPRLREADRDPAVPLAVSALRMLYRR